MERKNIIRLKLKVECAWEKDEKKGINPIQIMREFSNLNPKHQNQSNGTRISCVVKLLLLLFPPFNLNIESIRFNVFFFTNTILCTIGSTLAHFRYYLCRNKYSWCNGDVDGLVHFRLFTLLLFGIFLPPMPTTTTATTHLKDWRLSVAVSLCQMYADTHTHAHTQTRYQGHSAISVLERAIKSYIASDIIQKESRGDMIGR